MSAPRIYLRNSANERVAEVVDYRSFNYRKAFNDAGRWTMTVPRGVAAIISPGYALELQLPNGVLISGPITSVLVDAGVTMARIQGYDALYMLAKRLAYPEPGGDFASQDHDVRTGPVESVVKGYVRDNASDEALIVERRFPFRVAQDSGRGKTVTGRARFHNLLKLCAALISAAGDEYRMVLQDSVFDLEPIADRSGYPTFADWSGVTGYGYSWSAPQYDVLIAAGQGQGTARLVVERQNPADVVTFGRIEGFYDYRSAPSPGELVQYADAAIARAKSRVGYVLRINPQGWYGTEFAEGDLVTVQIDGKPFTGRILDVQIQYQEGGGWQHYVGVGIETVASLMGAMMARDMENRLENLEVSL